MTGPDGRSMPDVGTIAWETVPCPLCGDSNEELLLDSPSDLYQTTFRLVRCQSCGLGYLNPRPDVASIGRFYPDDYECYQPPTPRRSGWRSTRRWLEQLVLSHAHGYPPPRDRWYEKVLATLAGPWFGPSHDSFTAIPFQGEGRLLDYGCGSGWYAQRMKERGWTVAAMDFNRHAATQVARTFGIPTYVGTLPHPELAPESFDAITMGAVLEHVHWPHPLIEGAARTLRPGGLLVVSVPNLESWQHRYFGRDCWSLELPRHLLHFTPATLRHLAEAHGLEVEELRIVGRTSWMRRSLAAARRRPLREQPWLVRLGTLPGVASAITRYSSWTLQADCMTLIARKPATASVRLAA